MNKLKLDYKPTIVEDVLTEREKQEVITFCEGYKKFLGDAKTERECCAYVLADVKKAGFKEWDFKTKIKPGEKVYFVSRDKTITLIVGGTESTDKGVNMIISHIDSPRLDLKAKPLYEQDELAYFKTHYYGGIKKYQWTAIPLSIHGVIYKKDGSSVTVNVGEKEGEPQFTITDLLPHLGKKQAKQPLATAIKGEGLNILIGCTPIAKENDEQKSRVKEKILRLLNKKYGITEVDLMTAELEVVPAFKPSDIGFDESLIGGYGQDDRVCAYPAYKAICEIKNNKKTAVVILADKEEIGSIGITAPSVSFVRDIIADLSAVHGGNERLCVRNSFCLSSDVDAGFDPIYANVYEKRNTTMLGQGLAICKYSGKLGKSRGNDASAETFSKLARILEKNGIIWQTGELGKVDEGGGGTFAIEIARAGIEVIDAGVSVLSMHSPFEITHKNDIYMLYKTDLAILEKGE